MHAHNFDAYNINWPLTWTRPWETTKHSPFSENMPRERWSPTGAQSPVQCRIWFLTGRRPTGCIQHTKDGRLKYGYDIEKKKQQVCQICTTTKLQQNFLWRLKCRPLSEKEFIRWTITGVSSRRGTSGKCLILPCITRTQVYSPMCTGIWQLYEWPRVLCHPKWAQLKTNQATQKWIGRCSIFFLFLLPIF